MSAAEKLLEHPLVYRTWQAGWARDKFVPLLAHNDLSRVKRVLDVGCGPGTNTDYFCGSDYLGIDINPKYIAWARARYRREFAVADVTRYFPPSGERFDFVLVNSFLHHLDDEGAEQVLRQISGLLSEEGHVHLMELVPGDGFSPAALLTRLDRGRFARSLDAWRLLIGRFFEPVIFEPYRLCGFGITLWNMVYYKGRRKPGSVAHP